MVGGLLGLHYAYIRRWGLFFWQLTLFVGCVVNWIYLLLNPDSKWAHGERATIPFVVLLIMLISWLCSLGTKRDGQGGVLRKREFKSGWYWFFALFFGFAGVHLVYLGSFILLCIHMFFFIGTLFEIGGVPGVIKIIKTLHVDPEIYGVVARTIAIMLGTALVGWLLGLRSRKEKKS